MIEQNTNIFTTPSITRGVCQLLTDSNYAVMREFSLASGRRVDVAGLNKVGHFVIVEVKSSVPDFRNDDKWHNYLEFCDYFYFAVNADFPSSLLPSGHGLIIADAFNAIIERDSPKAAMNAQRRRAQTVRFARAAASRLEKTIRPDR